MTHGHVHMRSQVPSLAHDDHADMGSQVPWLAHDDHADMVSQVPWLAHDLVPAGAKEPLPVT